MAQKMVLVGIVTSEGPEFTSVLQSAETLTSTLVSTGGSELMVIFLPRQSKHGLDHGSVGITGQAFTQSLDAIVGPYLPLHIILRVTEQ